MQSDSPGPSPELFFGTAIAYQHTAIIKTAVELDVFSKIAEGNSTKETIAAACSASIRGIRILCDALTVLGFLIKKGSEYHLTESSAVFLVRSSPAFTGDAAEFLTSDALRAGFDNFTEAVRTGTNATNEGGTVSPDNPVWVKFARGMMGMMFPASQAMAGLAAFDSDREVRVLDVAAGHGIFGIMIANHHPNAHVYALDWANVLAVATENAEKFGVSERHHLIPGDAFSTDFGGPYDLILLTNFLHHFDPQTNEALLRKARAALKESGRVFTLEFVPNEDRVSPPGEALFSAVMLAGTPAGDAYTFTELETMFGNAGFERTQILEVPGSPQHLLISS